MKKITLILLLLASLNIKSQNFTFKDELQWTTYVCGDVITEGAENTQAVNDSLNVTPNPFQKRTSVYYSFSQNDTVSLTVYNRFGQPQVTIHTNSVMPSGAYQDSIIMDSYPDGVYVAILKLGVRKNIGKAIVKVAYAGINELNNNPQLKTYPNPVSNTIFISGESNEFENTEIEITNYLGQTVLKIPYSNQIDISKLSQGFYNLKITTANQQIFNSKVVKE